MRYNTTKKKIIKFTEDQLINEVNKTRQKNTDDIIETDTIALFPNRYQFDNYTILREDWVDLIQDTPNNFDEPGLDTQYYGWIIEIPSYDIRFLPGIETRILIRNKEDLSDEVVFNSGGFSTNFEVEDTVTNLPDLVKKVTIKAGIYVYQYTVPGVWEHNSLDLAYQAKLLIHVPSLTMYV